VRSKRDVVWGSECAVDNDNNEAPGDRGHQEIGPGGVYKFDGPCKTIQIDILWPSGPRGVDDRNFGYLQEEGRCFARQKLVL
jgi:hypothetical protein